MKDIRTIVAYLNELKPQIFQQPDHWSIVATDDVPDLADAKMRHTSHAQLITTIPIMLSNDIIDPPMRFYFTLKGDNYNPNFFDVDLISNESAIESIKNGLDRMTHSKSLTK